MAHGDIHWSELATGDVAGAKAFFEKIAGWTVVDTPMPEGMYHVCMVGEKPVAGIMSLDMIEGSGEMPPHWMTYIAVDDVDAAVRETAAAGGTVIREPFDVPQAGRIAIIQDPGGAVVGIMTPVEQG